MRYFLFVFFLLLVQVSSSQNKITNIQPKNGDILFDNEVLFNWNSSFLKSNSRKYFVEIADDSLMTAIVQSSLLIDSTSFTATFLPGKYYFRLRLFESNSIICSSDVMSFTYSEISKLNNLSVFLKADSGVFTSGTDSVFKWSNWADTASSAVQPMVAYQPTLINNIAELNNLDVIRFDGTDDVMRILSSTTVADLRAIARWGFSNQYFTRGVGLVTGGVGETWILKPFFSFTTSSFQPSILFPNFTINNIQKTDFTPLNEFKVLRSYGTTGINFSNLLVGNDRELSGRNWNGDVAEIIAFSAPVPDSINKIVDTYLCKKYGRDLLLGKDIISNRGFCDTLFTAVDTNYLSYLWSNGDTTYFSNLSPGNSYTLTVTNEFGCEFVDEISVVVPIELPEDQFLCLGDTFLFDTKLSKSDYSFLWNDLSTDSFVNITEQGDYFVTITDLNSCIYSSDTIRINYDSSLITYTLGPDTSVCRGNEISIVNGGPGIMSYLWSTGNTNSIQQIDTSGLYTLEIGNGTCFASDTVNVMVKGDAPIADFDFNNLCLGDSVQFNDRSSTVAISDTIENWRWKFGNGDSFLAQNPKYRYPLRNTYSVLLQVETNNGCADSISKTIEIEPLPNARFGFQNSVICSKSRIFHVDSSVISRGFIVNYSWNFGDTLSNQNTSQDRNPFHSYDTLGNYAVQLNVISDKGCLDSITRTFYINPTPFVDFSVRGSCISDSIKFFDSTILPSGNVRDYRWTVSKNGGSSFLVDQRQNSVFKINSSGEYIVNLRVRSLVTASQSCESNKSDTINFYENPVAGFTVPVICENDSFEVVTTTFPNDSIIRFRYVFNKVDTIRQQFPKFGGEVPGTYELELLVESEKNCTSTDLQIITVNEKPSAAFDILNNNTGIPFSIDLRNNTINADDYVWTFGTGDSSNSAVPNYMYTDTGSYKLNLFATSSVGCVDSTQQQVNALLGYIDADLIKIYLNENSKGDIVVSAQIYNSGFNTINEIVMVVDLNDEFEFRESFKRKIYTGRNDGFVFGSTFIPDAGRKIDFVCVRILSVNTVQDSIETNNQQCELGYNNQFTLKMYPNPVEEVMNLQYTLPDDGQVDFKIFDALGRKISNGFTLNQQEGYYTTLIDCSLFDRGIYYYRFTFNGAEKSAKFLVR